MQLWAGRVRILDVAYTSWDHLPGRGPPLEPIPDLAPDLAVEILGLSSTPAELTQKRADYFAAGVRLVWIVDLGTRIVSVYTAPETVQDLTEAHTLHGNVVLSGFALPVADLFAELDRQG